MDILSEIIHDSRWKGDLLARDSFYKPWGLKFPCDKSAGFHIVTQGKCYVRYKSKTILLSKGDIVFMARGFSHELASHENQKAMDIKKLRQIAEELTNNKNPITSFLSVRYEIGNAP
ncbi:MAG: cupin domain-containing protein, partial [Leptospiraceae bacterium]|nr:cupin domain-containing protein [Leptospiraceae bacterium]